MIISFLLLDQYVFIDNYIQVSRVTMVKKAIIVPTFIIFYFSGVERQILIAELNDKPIGQARQ
jgi:hypothetical protein